MYNLGERFGTFVIAAALLFAALRVHKSSGKHSRISKPAGVVLAFLSGCAFLVTFVGGWMAGVASHAPALLVAGLIVCAVVIAVDWGLDKKPDKPAFWAAFGLAGMIVFGMASVPRATSQVGTGFDQVTSQVSQVGGGNAPAPKGR